MLQVDFYIVPDQTPDARYRLACRLGEKAYQLGHRVYLYTENLAQAELLDDLLWTFKAESFLPHEIYPAAKAPPPPLLIGFDPDPNCDADVLINLTQEVPPFYGRFSRVVELVDGNPASREKARERYRNYQGQGVTLNSHTLTKESQ
jgi:DNA polymerase III, chi subunit